MAELLALEPIGSAAPEAADILQWLKRLPDGYLVRQWLDPTRPGLAFWLADAQERSALITVASARRFTTALESAGCPCCCSCPICPGRSRVSPRQLARRVRGRRKKAVRAR
jgi:hypothetical protein